MDVFLAGIMQGSKVDAEIHRQDWRERLRALLAHHVPEADVYCHYSLHPESLGYDLSAIRETFDDGLDRARRCDLLLAYLPEASMGTAIEMAVAAEGGAAVLTVTPMVGNWVVLRYSDRVFPDFDAFEAFLADGKLARLLAEKRAPA